MSETPPSSSSSPLPTAATANLASDREQAEQRIQDLLTQLAATYPTDTSVDQKLFLEKFDRATQRLHTAVNSLITGGVEPIRELCPKAGVPPEMAHQLYEILYNHSDPE